MDKLLVLMTLHQRFTISVEQHKQELVTLYTIFSVVMPAKPFERKQADDGHNDKMAIFLQTLQIIHLEEEGLEGEEKASRTH